MAGMVESSYYRTPSDGKKGKKPSELTFHKTRGYVSECEVLVSVKEILSHEFIDCGYRLMTSYLKKDETVANRKRLDFGYNLSK